MTLHFDRPSRSSSAGFTLLEAMVAFAVLGMVLAAAYGLSARVMRQQITAQQQYDAMAMARAVLDEYIVTYPAMPRAGSYKDSWDWQVTETPQERLERTDHDHFFAFVRITVQVQSRSSGAARLSTVIARRAQGS